MKLPKRIREFYFKDLTREQVVQLMNEEFPINIKYNEDLVNRIHGRYPLIEKSEVSIIVKGIFQSFRDLLILGKVLNFNKVFFDAKLFFIDFRKRGSILPHLKVKIKTPPPLRKMK
jgi:hypothetical protein